MKNPSNSLVPFSLLSFTSLLIVKQNCNYKKPLYSSFWHNISSQYSSSPKEKKSQWFIAPVKTESFWKRRADLQLHDSARKHSYEKLEHFMPKEGRMNGRRDGWVKGWIGAVVDFLWMITPTTFIAKQNYIISPVTFY